MKKNENSKQQEKSKKIILASSSPRRKELLKNLGLKFRVIPSGIDEKLNPRHKPRRQAEELSLQKALEVSKKISEGIIISADTIVVIEDEILGKPIDFREAKRFLKKLSGKKHSVITGVTVFDAQSKKRNVFSEITYVHMKILTPREIDNYIIKEDLSDKAGAYAIQGIGSVFFEKIEGDYFNIIGLPVHLLTKELKKFGIEVL